MPRSSLSRAACGYYKWAATTRITSDNALFVWIMTSRHHRWFAAPDIWLGEMECPWIMVYSTLAYSSACGVVVGRVSYSGHSNTMMSIHRACLLDFLLGMPRFPRSKRFKFTISKEKILKSASYDRTLSWKSISDWSVVLGEVRTVCES